MNILHKRWLTPLAFFVIGFALYASSLHNPFIALDDPMLIVDNPAIANISIRSVKHFFSTFDPELYIPVTFLSYQLDYIINGLDPFSFHLQNLLLHIVNALLVVLLLKKLTKNQIGATIGGLLFLVHPLQSEAVLWASARKDVLSACFFLLSMLSYMKHTKKWYYISLMLFILGALSKPVVIVLPLLLLLLDTRDGRAMRVQTILPFFCVSIVIGAIGLLGKMQILAHQTLLDKVLLSMRNITLTLQHVVWPTKLSLFYPYTEAITMMTPVFLVSLIVVAALLMAMLIRRNANQDIVFGMCWFLLLLAPTLLNFQKGENFGDIYITSDRYSYLPLIGIIFIVTTYMKHWKAGLALALVYCFLTVQQAGIWRTDKKLYKHALRYYPNAQVAHNTLGALYYDEGLIKQAADHYVQSIEIRPTGKAYANLGQAYFSAGVYIEAIASYKKAMELNPLNAPVQLQIGGAYAKLGQYQKAIDAMELTSILDPHSPVPYINLGILYEKIGKHAESIEAFQKAENRGATGLR
ncbi:MAG: tetratricopeptide repeat protein [bacterium]|nr:tetratricopeptide repeat protein [bacterium]